MTTRRIATRKLEEEGVHEGIPQGGLDPQGFKFLKISKFHHKGDQVPNRGEGNEVSVVPPDMTSGEISEALHALALAMITNVNKDVEPRVNAL